MHNQRAAPCGRGQLAQRRSWSARERPRRGARARGMAAAAAQRLDCEEEEVQPL